MTPDAYTDFYRALVIASVSLVDTIITSNLRASLSPPLNGSKIIIDKVITVFKMLTKQKRSNLHHILSGNCTECTIIERSTYYIALKAIFDSHEVSEEVGNCVVRIYFTAAGLSLSIFNSIIPTLRDARRLYREAITTQHANPSSPPISAALLLHFADVMASHFDRIMTDFELLIEFMNSIENADHTTLITTGTTEAPQENNNEIIMSNRANEVRTMILIHYFWNVDAVGRVFAEVDVNLMPSAIEWIGRDATGYSAMFQLVRGNHALLLSRK